MFIYINILSFYKMFLYFNLCLNVMLDSTVFHVHFHLYPFLLQTVPLLYFESKCNIGQSLMFIYIHILSYYNQQSF